MFVVNRCPTGFFPNSKSSLLGLSNDVLFVVEFFLFLKKVKRFVENLLYGETFLPMLSNKEDWPFQFNLATTSGFQYHLYITDLQAH